MDIDEDIFESSRLFESVDMEILSYQDSHRLIVGFCDEVLLSSVKEDGIDKHILKIANYITSQAIAFIKSEVSIAELEQCRFFTWMLHDKESKNSKERHLMRVMVFVASSCSKEYDRDGCGCFYEVFFSCLADFGKGHCKQFADYAITELLK